MIKLLVIQMCQPQKQKHTFVGKANELIVGTLINH